jgi:hypothetical protein
VALDAAATELLRTERRAARNQEIS